MRLDAGLELGGVGRIEVLQLGEHLGREAVELVEHHGLGGADPSGSVVQDGGDRFGLAEHLYRAAQSAFTSARGRQLWLQPYLLAIEGVKVSDLVVLPSTENVHQFLRR